MNYENHVLAMQPAVYFPFDDVVPGAAARQLGSSNAAMAYPAWLVRDVHSRVTKQPSRWGSLGAVAAVPPATSAFATGAEYTLAFWLHSSGGVNNYVSLGAPGTADNSLLLYPFFVDGNTYVISYEGGAMTWIVYPMVRSGTWTHIAISYSTVDGFKAYTNGQLRAQGVGAAPSYAAGNRSLFIGVDPAWRLQHLAMWNRPITTREARQLHRLHGT